MIAAFRRYLPRERYYKPESVLEISHFGFAYQPLPIEIAVFDRDPGKSLKEADLDVARSDRRKEYVRGIPAACAGQPRETRISQAGQCARNGRRIPGAIMIDCKWQRYRAEAVEFDEPRGKLRCNGTPAMFDEGEIGL
jgi:hypothetical protein